MVVVNKKQFYANMLQPTQTLDNHYKLQTNEKAEEYIQEYTLISYTNRTKLINSIFATLIFILSFAACIVTLNRDYNHSKMPSHILTYSLKPWDEYDSLDNTLKAFTNASSTVKDNVNALWFWSRCSEYITTGRVPKSTDKMVLEEVSATNPVYMPGGCNCIAQVAHAMGAGWLYASSTAPNKDQVEEMLNFCTYEGSMPQTLEIGNKPYRTMFFLYGFLILASASIIIANFMHDALLEALKMKKGGSEPEVKAEVGTVSDLQARINLGIQTPITMEKLKQISAYLKVKLILVTLICTVVLFTMTILLLSDNKGAPSDAKHPAYAFATIYIVSSFFILMLFVTPYIMYNASENNISEVVKKMSMHEVDKGILFVKKEEELVYKQSDILNAQGQIEQLWTDVISIPAVVALTIAVCIMRQWTDFDIIVYNVLLVFLFLLFTTASNWVTCHWTRVAKFMGSYSASLQTSDTIKHQKLGSIRDTLNGFYQGYKNIIMVTQFFILIALVFTATPSSDVSHYNYLAMYNWLYFIFFIFLIYVAPDIWNDLQEVKLHNVTAMKQFMLNLLTFTIFVTVSYTEFWNKSVVT